VTDGGGVIPAQISTEGNEDNEEAALADFVLFVTFCRKTDIVFSCTPVEQYILSETRGPKTNSGS
jgi:hypothetical protein